MLADNGMDCTAATHLLVCPVTAHLAKGCTGDRDRFGPGYRNPQAPNRTIQKQLPYTPVFCKGKSRLPLDLPLLKTIVCEGNCRCPALHNTTHIKNSEELEMTLYKVWKWMVALSLITLLLMAGCASTSYIEVTYQLPPPEQTLGSKTVFLQVVDQRTTATIAGPNAQKELEYFTGLFSLYVAREGQKPDLIGAFDLAQLFKEALRRRLESEGVSILDKSAADQPNLEIQLQQFVLDRDGKNWKADLAYKAVISKSDRVLTNQNVSGSAERLKIVGTRDAEKLLGEIFSDMVNKLDPEKLFNHPDL